MRASCTKNDNFRCSRLCPYSPCSSSCSTPCSFPYSLALSLADSSCLSVYAHCICMQSEGEREGKQREKCGDNCWQCLRLDSLASSLAPSLSLSNSMYAHNYPIKLKLRCVLRHVKSPLPDRHTERQRERDSDRLCLCCCTWTLVCLFPSDFLRLEGSIASRGWYCEGREVERLFSSEFRRPTWL